MDINIQSIGFVADVKLETFIENKLGKIMKLDGDVTGAEVFLRLEKSATTENKVVEISLDIKGADIFAKKQSKTFEESTDMAVDALRRQVVRHKEKLREKKKKKILVYFVIDLKYFYICKPFSGKSVPVK